MTLFKPKSETCIHSSGLFTLLITLNTPLHPHKTQPQLMPNFLSFSNSLTPFFLQFLFAPYLWWLSSTHHPLLAINMQFISSSYRSQAVNPSLLLHPSIISSRNAHDPLLAIVAMVDLYPFNPVRLRRRLLSIWSLRRSFTVEGHAGNFYVLRFQNAQDLNFICSNSPWALDNALIVADYWQPRLIFQCHRLGSFPLWVQYCIRKCFPLWFQCDSHKCTNVWREDR